MTPEHFTEASGPDYIDREEFRDALDERERFLLGLINSMWREVVWLRALLGLTGLALLLLTVVVALRV